jgi:hypothetical protein
MATLAGKGVDWFRNTDNPRLYVRFRLNGGQGQELQMLRSAYLKEAPSLVFPNAVVVTKDAAIMIDIAAREMPNDVGFGFSITTGVRNRSPTATDGQIANPLFSVGPSSFYRIDAAGGIKEWIGSGSRDNISGQPFRIETVRRFQKPDPENLGRPNMITVGAVRELVKGAQLVSDKARVLPRMSWDISAFSIRAYIDGNTGEQYYDKSPPPDEPGPDIFAGNPPTGNVSDDKQFPNVLGGAVIGTVSDSGGARQKFDPVEIQDADDRADNSGVFVQPDKSRKLQRDSLGRLHVTFFVRY